MSQPRTILAAASGRRIELARGELLRIEAPEGPQVADLMAIARDDHGERLSSGRSFDYNGTLFLTQGHTLYSNRSRALLSIVEDTAGRHDFLYAPCSQEMFAIQYGVSEAHPNCLDNLAGCFGAQELTRDAMPTPFNVFMRVDVDPRTGKLEVGPPSSIPGTHVELRAELDLIVAVSACSAERTNGGRLKPIAVEVLPGGDG